ncbi:hypothetical protein HYV31_00010 [candidate division WWE3 bacterium]|nr:hypothetical protein [candidate division WWE3 bacterium]
MERLGLHIYIHQPYDAGEKAIRNAAENLYIPMFRAIKNARIAGFSLSITLSTLEQLESYNYKNLLQDIKDLVDSGTLELVPCPAYNTTISNTSSDFVCNQIVLNEYALGYYFGMRHGFEGEPAILVKDVTTCFYPGFDVNQVFLDSIKESGYELLQNPNIMLSFVDPTLSETYDGGMFSTLDHNLNISSKICPMMLSPATQQFELDPGLQNSFVSLPLVNLFTLNNDMSYRFSRLLDKLSEWDVEVTKCSNIFQDNADESKCISRDVESLLELINGIANETVNYWDTIITQNTKNENEVSTSAVAAINTTSEVKNVIKHLINIYEKARSLHTLHKRNESTSGNENVPLWSREYTKDDPALEINIQLNRLTDAFYLNDLDELDADQRKSYLEELTKLASKLDASDKLAQLPTN